jgi:hypothetical protein
MAYAWLSRMDREKVKSALEKEYIHLVAYPESLEVLTTRPKPPPLKDRWGREWNYRLTGFKLLSGLHGQRYVLESSKLKSASDLNQALARPYGADTQLKFLREISRKAGSEIAELSIEKDSNTSTAVFSLGSSKAGFTYAYRGKGFMILANDYWHVVGARNHN